MKIRLYTT